MASLSSRTATASRSSLRSTTCLRPQYQLRCISTTNPQRADVEPTTPNEAPSDSDLPPPATGPVLPPHKHSRFQQDFKINHDARTVYGGRAEKKFFEMTGKHPVGSRRMRAAIRISQDLKFEELPYQCFQEARKILLEDREEKIALIKEQRDRIAHHESKPVESFKAGEFQKSSITRDLKAHLEKLKILADVNDPVIKKKFEDGLADYRKPIYRYYAKLKWEEQKKLVLEQRISTMHIVPDVLPKLEVKADLTIVYNHKNVDPGSFVQSVLSQTAPILKIQLFEAGMKKVTVAVVDPDVPDPEMNAFSFRTHFLASNIDIEAHKPTVDLRKLDESNIAVPWLPPHAQMGSPYHRIMVLVYEQPNNEPVDVEFLRAKMAGDRPYNARLLSSIMRLQPLTGSLFRTEWDEGTKAVMLKHGLPGVDVQFKRKKDEKAPFKRKNPERYR